MHLSTNVRKCSLGVLVMVLVIGGGCLSSQDSSMWHTSVSLPDLSHMKLKKVNCEIGNVIYVAISATNLAGSFDVSTISRLSTNWTVKVPVAIQAERTLEMGPVGKYVSGLPQDKTGSISFVAVTSRDSLGDNWCLFYINNPTQHVVRGNSGPIITMSSRGLWIDDSRIEDRETYCRSISQSNLLLKVESNVKVQTFVEMLAQCHEHDIQVSLDVVEPKVQK